MGTYTLTPHPQFDFLRVDPRPTQAEIAKFYADEFYSGDYKRLNDSSLEVQMDDKDFYDCRWEDMCHGIAEVSEKPLAGQSVLDIGCGWGQALLYFQKAGMKCHGFDPAPEAVDFACKNGLDVKVAGLENMDVFEKRFDIVTLINVLEHLADPVSVIEEIREKVLEPSGMLVIDVPNEFNVFQVTGQQLHGLDQWWVYPPAHLNYFSKTTLSKLLEGSGFTVRLAEAAFPLEMFLLFGRQYVGDPTVGKACHKERVAFELNMRKYGKTKELRQFYRCLAEINIGRQVVVYARAL